MNNKYYIISLPEPATEAILSHCVQTNESARRSLDGSKMLVKLPVGADKPASFNAFTEYTHSEILVELATAEWTPDDII